MISQLKLERIKREVSQNDLELRIGIPQWRISLIERGLRPKQYEIEKFSIALKVNADALFPNLNKEGMVA